jgi:hypothetical protein
MPLKNVESACDVRASHPSLRPPPFFTLPSASVSITMLNPTNIGSIIAKLNTIKGTSFLRVVLA